MDNTSPEQPLQVMDMERVAYVGLPVDDWEPMCIACRSMRVTWVHNNHLLNFGGHVAIYRCYACGERSGYRIVDVPTYSSKHEHRAHVINGFVIASHNGGSA